MEKGGSGPGTAFMEPNGFSSVQSRQSPLEMLLNRADSYFRKGDFKSAARAAERILEMSSGNAEAHGILGAINAFTGKVKKAQETLNRMEELGGDSFYELLIRGLVEISNSDFGKAQNYLDKAAEMKSEHPAALFFKGHLALLQGDSGRAETLFLQVADDQPAFPPALGALGRIYDGGGQAEKAVDYCKRAVSAEPENLIYRKELIRLYRSAGDKEKADHQLKQMLYYTPGVKQKLLSDGRRLIVTGGYQEAIELMDRILPVYRDVSAAHYLRAMALINLSDKKSALESVKRFVEEQRGNPIARHLAGMCYMALEKYHDADREFKIVISMKPDMGKSFVPLTIIEQLKGNHQRALQGLQIAGRQGEPRPFISFLQAHLLLDEGDRQGYLVRMKDSAELVPGLGKDSGFLVPAAPDTDRFAEKRNLMMLFFMNGWYEKAASFCRELIEMNRTDRFAWYYKALCESAQEKHTAAVKSFNSLIALEPSLYSAYMALGQLYYKTEDLENAARSFEKVLKLKKDYGPAYAGMGDAYLQMKDRGRAISFYKKAAALAPDMTALHRKLIFLLSEDEADLPQALEYARKLREISPEDPFADDAAGWVHLKNGNIDKGFELISKASAALPENPVILYHLGVAYYQKGLKTECRSALQSALNRASRFAGSEHALELLEACTR